jgi:hypothetical protein
LWAPLQYRPWASSNPQEGEAGYTIDLFAVAPSSSHWHCTLRPENQREWRKTIESRLAKSGSRSAESTWRGSARNIVKVNPVTQRAARNA